MRKKILQKNLVNPLIILNQSTENINASEEKTAVTSDSEASSSANCNIVQETENNNLEEKSTKETTAE